jgi:hypothetical protein
VTVWDEDGRVAGFVWFFSGLFLALLFFLMWARDRRRIDEFRQEAALLGLAFSEVVPRRDLFALACLPLIRLTVALPKTGAWLRLVGQFRGRQVIFLEQCVDGPFSSEDGKVQLVWQQALVVLDAPALPNFVLSPEHGLWDEVGQEWLEERPGGPRARPMRFFLRGYLLWGKPPRAVRRVFGTAAVAYFARSPGWSVESWDGRLLIYQQSHCAPRELSSLLVKAVEIASLLEGPQLADATSELTDRPE